MLKIIFFIVLLLLLGWLLAEPLTKALERNDYQIPRTVQI